MSAPSDPADWDDQVRVQSAAIDTFSDFIQRCMTQRTAPSARNVSVMALALKAIWTAQSIRLLAGAAHYGDAIALGRVLFENVINAAYLRIADDATVQRYWDFAPVESWNWMSQLIAVFPESAQKFGDEFINRCRANYEFVKGNFPGREGRKNWTDQSLFDRAREVDKACNVDTFAYLFNNYSRPGNAFVHSTSSALYPYCVGESDTFHIRPLQPSAEEQAKVLAEAVVALMILAGTVDLLFDGNHVAEFVLIRQEWYAKSADIRLDVEASE